MQSKLESIFESLTNIILGYFIALITQIIIFPIFNIHTTPIQNIKIALIFSIVSICRNYLIRRFFNLKIRRINDNKNN